MTTRRSFMASILAAGFAPAAIGSGILMPVRKVWVPPLGVRGYVIDECFQAHIIQNDRYLQLTKAYVDGASARLEDILFPPHDRNWLDIRNIQPTPLPERTP